MCKLYESFIESHPGVRPYRIDSAGGQENYNISTTISMNQSRFVWVAGMQEKLFERFATKVSCTHVYQPDVITENL